ncbi:hypothetical protein FHS68_004621 [Dyadobacter arcticus]|uniref:Uncharacterized protein n=1 Tax=Dyadobacter arcticus TaxID=1078754 RepID=A0ABX0UR46_9BACT|nr:hypothetical protein [Dyadobacter arcticus]
MDLQPRGEPSHFLLCVRIGDCAEVKNNSFKFKRQSKETKALPFFSQSIAPGDRLFRSYFLSYNKKGLSPTVLQSLSFRAQLFEPGHILTTEFFNTVIKFIVSHTIPIAKSLFAYPLCLPLIVQIRHFLCFIFHETRL